MMSQNTSVKSSNLSSELNLSNDEFKMEPIKFTPLQKQCMDQIKNSSNAQLLHYAFSMFNQSGSFSSINVNSNTHPYCLIFTIGIHDKCIFNKQFVLTLLQLHNEHYLIKPYYIDESEQTKKFYASKTSNTNHSVDLIFICHYKSRTEADQIVEAFSKEFKSKVDVSSCSWDYRLGFYQYVFDERTYYLLASVMYDCLAIIGPFAPSHSWLKHPIARWKELKNKIAWTQSQLEEAEKHHKKYLVELEQVESLFSSMD